MYWLSEYLLLPSGLIVLFAVCAVLARLWPRVRPLSVWFVTAAMVMFFIFGSGLTAFSMMAQLEFKYPATQDAPGRSRPDIIVVLTGYAQKYEGTPITGHANASSGFRVLETVRIFNRKKESTVIVSGSRETVEIMRDLLIELGVPERSITTDPDSNSTYDSAVHLCERLTGKPFFLVTSAGHMPRAMGAFRKQGLQPLPAPTHYLSSASMSDSNILPNGRHLAISDLAVHEYLGLLWYRVLDRL